MRKLKISRTDFELAFELSSYETTAYLDTETSMVIFVEGYVVDQLEALFPDKENLEAIEAALKAKTDLSDINRQQLLDAARVEWDDKNRYRMIPKQDSQEPVTGTQFDEQMCVNVSENVPRRWGRCWVVVSGLYWCKLGTEATEGMA